MRQGPHHGAQKSTKTGISLRVMCFSKLLLPSSIGCALNRACLHLPQFGWLVNFPAGMRFTASQLGQTILMESLMIVTSVVNAPYMGNDSLNFKPHR
ncbi:protein of unknown function [Candidatus Nitrotoga arctica]|uniref:Uncharacterized protein n=1 Tax=Candidatus Nitrotoga arctica TaxID=453162 RepID=A0ABM8YVY7_9PROT|nr:protein of unknown function [Candidatus Nitrotoga arctica]